MISMAINNDAVASFAIVAYNLTPYVIPVDMEGMEGLPEGIDP